MLYYQEAGALSIHNMHDVEVVGGWILQPSNTLLSLRRMNFSRAF